MKFFLGSHKPQWLSDERFLGIPLFISRRMLAKKKRLPRATTSWALDSGGFTELQMFGSWTVTPKAYVAEVLRFRDEIGKLEWAAPQDWMCEPQVLAGNDKFKGTHKSITEHQRLTVENFLELRELAPDVPFVPVLQGWSMADYWRCMDMYEARGVALSKETTVGIGTMCRRQSTHEAVRILATVASCGVRLHGFGFKADSLAWSYTARMKPPITGHDKPGPGRPRGHKNCANCADYALRWRGEIVKAESERALARAVEG